MTTIVIWDMMTNAAIHATIDRYVGSKHLTLFNGDYLASLDNARQLMHLLALRSEFKERKDMFLSVLGFANTASLDVLARMTPDSIARAFVVTYNDEIAVKP